MSTSRTQDPNTELSPEEQAVEIEAAAQASSEQLQRQLAHLSPAQRELLLLRLARRTQEMVPHRVELVAGPQSPGIDVPLSFAQERMWFLERMSPGDPSRILCGALRLRGSLARAALRATLDAIVARHEPLRASISTRDGRPVQVIHHPAPAPLRELDISSLAADEREAERQRLFAEESRTPFDLSAGRLLRASLVRVADDDNTLLLAMHHIAADGWSLGVVMAELRQIYAALVRGREPGLPPLPVQYGDFARWQRDKLDKGGLERELGYWRVQLADPPPVLDLPPDRRSAVGRASRGRTCGAALDRGLRTALEQLARDEQTTLFVTLLCGFMVLLLRLTEREDLIVGLPVSGRSRVETEPMVGLFINTLVLRAKLSGTLSFRDNLARVRRAFLDGLEHIEIPFERLVQELAPERSAGSHPLFETVFNLTPRQTRRLDLPGLDARFETPPERGAKFSMEFSVTEFDDALEFELLYPSERYSDARMRMFLAQYQALLAEACRQPDVACAQLDLCKVDDAHADPSKPIEPDDYEPLVHAIARHVAEAPASIALAQGSTVLSYRQLAEAMAGVADLLEARGLGPGDVVAVAGARSARVATAMAGVFLRRCVLLTLSPDLPPERRRVMCCEAGVRAVLYTGARPEELRDLGDAAFIDLDEVRSSPEPSFATHLARVPRVADRAEPAYVFFTSGSTGVPKGVQGTTAGLAHFLAWQRTTFSVGPGDRCAQLTGLSFDVVLRDMFLALSSGATLVLPVDLDALAGPRILRWFADERVTVVHTVPSVLASWLLGPAELSLDGLRWLFSAGEPLSASVVERWRARCSGAVVNLYGPTETSLAKLFHIVSTPVQEGIQPLGRPLPHTQVLVLDEQRRLCALGEPGEIAIHTPFRSLGYINAPDEQRRRFIPNPWGTRADDLLYLTGDRGVLDADGLLRFLGRIDHQIKIRGVRVEPSEVAAALSEHPDVASCAVVPREDGPSGLTLVAYVVPARSRRIHIGRLPVFLRRSLPGPMIPSSFVVLDALPLTANHKLDRLRLPPPGPERTALEGRYIGPRDETELALVAIWEALLKVQPVGVADNFFELGGHSLLALHLLAEIEARLGVRVQLAAFVEGPTIENLAALARVDRPISSLVTLAPGEGVPLFLVHPGGGMLWNYMPLVRRLRGVAPLIGLQARGLDDDEPPHDDLRAMAEHYVNLVVQVQPEGPVRLAGHSLGGLIAVEMASLLHHAGRKVELVALFDALLRSPRTSELPDERTRDARALVEMVEVIERFTGRSTGLGLDALLDLDTDQQLDNVVDALDQIDALPIGHGPARIRRLLNVSKAHGLARRAYLPRPCPVPLVLFRAEQANHELSEADLATLGWGTVAEVDVCRVPGDHVTMMKEPNVAVLADALQPRLGGRPG
ncbi:amino acid adenylation domain-containing protein [Sorangium sp. So ce375]|uniref:non-ribosomal peptide synthetase n=1 Tax=Sorangium sp. So ce375 TaxID=3133306 RepID=UPI003F5AE761